MKPYNFIGLLLIVIAVGIYAMTSRNTLSPTKPVPNMTLILTSGEIDQLYDYQGHPTVLHFWATWCGPCKKEFPRLLRLAKKHPQWQLILISVDEKMEAVPPFMKKIEGLSGISLASMPKLVQVWDKGKHISQDTFQVVSYPETIFLSSDMRPLHKVVGPIKPEDWPH